MQADRVVADERFAKLYSVDREKAKGLVLVVAPVVAMTWPAVRR